MPAARGQISRKAHLAAASEDWGHSPCRRQPASTQTRRRRQHHSEDYCEREVDELELQGGRVYLHLGGLTEFGEWEARCSVAVARIRRLGVDRGFSFMPTSGRPRIMLELPGRVWWQQPETVNAVVEDHAARNAEKLARSGRAERHLFVLLDSGEEVAWSVMLDGELPQASPQLPEASQPPG